MKCVKSLMHLIRTHTNLGKEINPTWTNWNIPDLALTLVLTCFLARLPEQILLKWLLSTKARWPPSSFSSTRVGTATPTTIESSDGRIFSRFCPFFPGFKARQLNLSSCRISSSQENVLDHLNEVSNGDFLGNIFIAMEALQYLQMVWFKSWHQMVEAPAISKRL